MTIRPSPEIEALMRRIWQAWHAGDMATIANVFSDDAYFRAIGSDEDEWWVGREEFLRVRRSQFEEMPPYEIDIHEVVAFEEGSVGWAAISLTMVTPVMSSLLRTSAVLRIEAGTWRVVFWHNSLPVSNEQMFGVGLTTSLDQLLASIAEEGSPIVMADGLEGTMTVLFTDIVDSTVLAETRGDRLWAGVVTEHESVIREIAQKHGGEVVKTLGDGSMIAFTSARSAVRTAVEIQQALSDDELEIRIGIHTGEVVRTADDVLGLTVNKAARIAAAAAGGQIMVSSTVRDLVGSLEAVRFGPPVTVALKGLSDTHQIVPLEWDPVSAT